MKQTDIKLNENYDLDGSKLGHHLPRRLPTYLVATVTEKGIERYGRKTFVRVILTEATIAAIREANPQVIFTPPVHLEVPARDVLQLTSDRETAESMREAEQERRQAEYRESLAERGALASDETLGQIMYSVANETPRVAESFVESLRLLVTRTEEAIERLETTTAPAEDRPFFGRRVPTAESKLFMSPRNGFDLQYVRSAVANVDRDFERYATAAAQWNLFTEAGVNMLEVQ